MTGQPQLAVEITGLRKSFGPLEVLKGIALEAKQGEVVSILGSSGSGKSTLQSRQDETLAGPGEGPAICSRRRRGTVAFSRLGSVSRQPDLQRSGLQCWPG